MLPHTTALHAPDAMAWDWHHMVCAQGRSKMQMTVLLHQSGCTLMPFRCTVVIDSHRTEDLRCVLFLGLFIFINPAGWPHLRGQFGMHPKPVSEFYGIFTIYVTGFMTFYEVVSERLR